MMMRNLLRFGRRQLHTIVSRDIIKPSSPTPSHLKTYNLSLFDQLALNAYVPVVAIYPCYNNNIYQNSHDKTVQLKNSLSHTLSRYYPFAGRFVKDGPTYASVECNDEGVEFIEACNDTPLSDFLQQSDHEDLDQLFPDDLIWYNSKRKGKESNSTTPMSVQVNHFPCGGVAVAVSLSHKIADGSSAFNFINHWAKVTRSGLSDMINPHFIDYKTRVDVDMVPKNLPDRAQSENVITRSFVFPNSKINDLKAKITSMTMESGEPPIMNPTRVEALTWLIHNRAMAAASKRNSVVSKATGVAHVMNLRNNMAEQLPETSIGNLVMVMDFPKRNESELLTPSSLIGEFRKIKKSIRGIRNTETILGITAEICKSDPAAIVHSIKKLDDYYVYSAINRFPTYEIDFGWGKPIKVTLGGGLPNVVVMMNTPNGDGTEALVSLDRQDMDIIQHDPELLAFC